MGKSIDLATLHSFRGLRQERALEKLYINFKPQICSGLQREI